MSKTNEKILNVLKKLPDQAGIYKMYNEENTIIYIGKAKNLKKRVKQYFQKNYNHSTRTKKLLENVRDIKFTSVDSELEAIILENNLIKEFKPKYNILLKDDKSYVYIKITKENFPRIQIVRQIQKDNATYYGPKTASGKVKDTLKLIKKLFPYRHCNLDISLKIENKIIPHEVEVTNKVIKYPCLDFHIKRCIAPCIGRTSIEEYKKIIDDVKNFLEGKGDEVIKNLKIEMYNFAELKKFEKAAKIRDKINKIKELLEKQKISDPNRKDTDIINYIITQNKAFFNLFQIRDGNLIGQENFKFTATDYEENENSEEVLESFIKQYYEVAKDLPKEILVPHKFENIKEHEEIINEIADKKLKIIIPKIGEKIKLLELSLKNAKIYADRNKTNWLNEDETTIHATKELKKILNIKTELKRIECYDISHLSGTNTVGSMVVFEKGAPKKSMYRKFNIKTVKDKPDDFKSMYEILLRRLKRIKEEKKLENKEKRKYQKKDNEIISKELENLVIEKDKTDLKDFYILEKDNKTIIGFVALKNHSDKVHEIYALWVSEKFRKQNFGEKLLKEIINKSSNKRIYIYSSEKLLDFYLKTGFEEIKKTPEELKNTNQICSLSTKKFTLIYDKNKHIKDESFSKIPDLLIIDGGKGQLKQALKVLKELDLKIPHISLAKRLEEIFIPGEKTSIILEKNNEALKLLQRARDEAHRFAVTFQREKRKIT